MVTLVFFICFLLFSLRFFGVSKFKLFGGSNIVFMLAETYGCVLNVLFVWVMMKLAWIYEFTRS